MNGKRLMSFIACVTLASFMVMGCDSGTLHGNGNANNANTNLNANRADANANRNDGRANSNMSRDDFDRQKDSFAKQARDLGRTIGTGADDLWIWTKIRAALASADDLRDSTINVDVDNNVATLSGTVANAAQKTRAAQVARGIEGVKNVVDKLQVGASGTGANTNGNRNGNGNRRQ
ncbi:MAG TPA: BON domain-containing protein [Blastocatellia bacterium]|nr:BON domain-containing protein [Blastocatellia bacterium]